MLDTLLKVIPQRYRTFFCSPCKQPLKALINQALHCKQAVCSCAILMFHKVVKKTYVPDIETALLWLPFCISAQYRSSSSRAGFCSCLGYALFPLASSVSRFSWAHCSSICGAVIKIPVFAFAVFMLSSSFSLLLSVCSEPLLPFPRSRLGGILETVSPGEQCLQTLTVTFSK